MKKTPFIFVVFAIIVLIGYTTSTASSPVINSITAPATFGAAQETYSVTIAAKNDVIVVFLDCFTSYTGGGQCQPAATNPVTDTAGNTYVKEINVSAIWSGTDQAYSYLYMANATSSGSDSITITFKTSSGLNAFAIIYDITMPNNWQPLFGVYSGTCESNNACSSVQTSGAVTGAPSTLFLLSSAVAFTAISSWPIQTWATGSYNCDVNSAGVQCSSQYNSSFVTGGTTNMPFNAATSEYAIAEVGFAMYLVSPPVTVTETALNFPNATSMNAGFEFILAIMIPVGLMLWVPLTMKSREAYVFVLLIGLTIGSVIGALLKFVPYSLIFVFGGYLAIYIWKGRSSGAQTGVPVS